MRSTGEDFAQLTKDMSYRTCLSRSADWARNLVANEYTIRNGLGINSFFGLYEDMPGILVGAGPSLDKNIGLLSDCYNKAVIVSCDAAHKGLTRKGIKPHFVLATDSLPLVHDHLDYGASEGTVLIVSSLIHPSTYEDWQGPVFWFNNKPFELSPLTHSLIEFTGRIGELSSHGGVATTIFSFLLGLHCNPVIFVGLDSGYYDAKEHHVTGAEARDFSMYAEMEELDIWGNKCYTNVALLAFAVFFEKVMVHGPAKIYINATEGGIISRGCLIMTLENVMKQFLGEEYDVLGLLEELQPDIEELNKKRWHYDDGEKVAEKATYFPLEFVQALATAYVEVYGNGCSDKKAVS